MHVCRRTLFVLSALATMSWAGALRLEVRDPAANPEAQAKKAVLVASITACQSPEKTVISATAEGMIDGSRKEIPLTVLPLSTPGIFAVTHGWPQEGNWAVKLIARNPDYKNYATAVLVPVEKNSLNWAGVKHYYHAPTSDEVSAVLGSRSLALAQ